MTVQKFILKKREREREREKFNQIPKIPNIIPKRERAQLIEYKLAFENIEYIVRRYVEIFLLKLQTN